MPRTWFSPAVCVETEIPGCSYAVTSAEKAAELLREWPRGPECRRAVQACAAAISGRGTAEAARHAFAEAAEAAERLIVPVQAD